ncbi:hypothetical protein AJ80_05141 [Polytolypa hystricis UAMH7299]|uniref:Paf1 complex protein n=1 Tax=Polytolypa hystricis (strain UAMH7299) TaxID=1447883 RepID=A0A2B7Y6A6_POLH7|nr:hypothetical protein AJ80_05141 [Polytolypa hystricis UAMH7299]
MASEDVHTPGDSAGKHEGGSPGVFSWDTTPDLNYTPPPTTSPGSDSMSKSKEGPAEGFHQEYIASLRYRNDLPPPEMPPKFLEIPHEGLDRFLTPGFASNLARREEPNIDVDAEGGMPIDLVGIPGLHLGDESAIMAPENPPPLDPADLQLLMTPDQLRNPAPKNANVSFLRRTQYIATGGGGRGIDGIKPSPTANVPLRTAQPKPKSARSRDDPIHVKKYIQKGFDIAYPESRHTGDDTASRIRGLPASKTEQDAWENPVHPDNPNLKPVGFYPIIPDLTGFPDPGGFLQIKFDKAPVQAVKGKRDDRMDVSIIMPTAPEERVCQDHASKAALHKANPKLYPDPGPVPYNYELFLPEKTGTTAQIKSSLNMSNPHKDDQAHYTHENSEHGKFHRYERIRTYATNTQSLNMDSKYKDVAITLFDPAEAKASKNHSVDATTTTPSNEGKESQHRLKQKGAYYYPILGKLRIKPERSRTIAQAGLGSGRGAVKDNKEEEQIHQMQVVVRDPDETEAYKRATHRAQVDSKFASSLPAPAPEEGEEEEVVVVEKEEPAKDEDGEGELERDASPVMPTVEDADDLED